MRTISVRNTSNAILAGMLIPVAISTGALLAAPSAAADSKTVTVNTGSGNLNVRSAPSTKSALLGTIRNGTKLVIVCYVHGDVFAGGPFGGNSDIWNRREGGGYTTDRLLDTGSNDPVVPPCGGPDAGVGPGTAAVSSRIGSPAD